MKPDFKQWLAPGALVAAIMCAVVFLWSTPFLWMQTPPAR